MGVYGFTAIQLAKLSTVTYAEFRPIEGLDCVAEYP